MRTIPLDPDECQVVCLELDWPSFCWMMVNLQRMEVMRGDEGQLNLLRFSILSFP